MKGSATLNSRLFCFRVVCVMTKKLEEATDGLCELNVGAELQFI